ncbi:hypothetical protein [Pseudaminobacter sp. NGMCC 1.201702]|uniref:hypothetical protein n=1 Tax=Pseudaminobacter sp. NGMCC 1.201702 TaxID=3391825 RepID=UPI0039F0292D
MTETELFSLVGFIILILGAVSGAWWRVESKVMEAKESAYHKSDSAMARADTAIATASLAREELSSYKTHVAETYISKAGHRETTDQIMAALNGVKTAVDGTNQRIDRLFDDRPERRNAS